MKVVIFCGGQGNRLRLDTTFRHKSMLEVGGRPLLWHIMKLYSGFGYREFVLLLGRHGEDIRRYFLDLLAMSMEVSIDIGSRSITVHGPATEESEWRVTFVDTGADTPNGGRLLRAASHYEHGAFFLTYGDGLSNVNLRELLASHRASGKLMTITGVRTHLQVGEMEVENGLLRRFREKPAVEGSWANGGFFVMEPAALAYMRADEMLEHAALARMAKDRQIAVHHHKGYWAALDTFQDLLQLNEAWASGKPGWLEPIAGSSST